MVNISLSYYIRTSQRNNCGDLIPFLLFFFFTLYILVYFILRDFCGLIQLLRGFGFVCKKIFGVNSH